MMKNVMRITILLAFLACQGAWAEKFTLPVLPDTQCEVNSRPEMFTSQLDWIVSNQQALKIPFVIHVGDLVDWDTPDHRMWKTASEGMKKLDQAGIPYALTLGNHDTAAVGGGRIVNGKRTPIGGSAAPGDVHANVRITKQFNAFFPVSRLTAQQGRYEEGKSDNAFYTFRAGGVDWLALSLELWARQGPIDWANKVVASHPNHNVIVVTHSHLRGDGMIEQRNGGYGDNSPQYIYDHFIKLHPNILMVLCGHVGTSAWRNDAGAQGNRIYQLLQDYQGEASGGGYIRLLEIDTEARTISAKMYSPFLKKTREDKSAFSFKDVKFIQHGGAK